MSRICCLLLVSIGLILSGCGTTKPDQEQPQAKPRILLLNATECQADAASAEEAFEACRSARANFLKALNQYYSTTPRQQ